MRERANMDVWAGEKVRAALEYVLSNDGCVSVKWDCFERGEEPPPDTPDFEFIEAAKLVASEVAALYVDGTLPRDSK
jgi:hypothetical protein